MAAAVFVGARPGAGCDTATRGESGVTQLMEHLVVLLHNWISLVPDPFKHCAFSVDTAEAVVAYVYGQEQAKWWGAMDPASLPAVWHGEILDCMTACFFADSAAYDVVAYSNSYMMERDYCWGGICIEPQAHHWQGLLHCKFVAVAAVMGHAIGAEVEFDSQYRSGVVGLVSDDMPNRVVSCHPLPELGYGGVRSHGTADLSVRTVCS